MTYVPTDQPSCMAVSLMVVYAGLCAVVLSLGQSAKHYILYGRVSI